MPLPAAAALGLKAAPYLLGAARLLGRRRRGANWDQLQQFSQGLRPSGYLNQADYIAGEGVRRRLSGAATESGANLRLEALRRLRQRGVDVAGASEATLGRIGETEAAGHERAAQGAEEYLGNVRLGNQQFEQQKALQLLSGRIGEATGERSRADLRDTTFFNSLLDITPSIMGGLDQLSAGTAAAESPLERGSGRYNPATGMFDFDSSPTDAALGVE
jgi:hypothetical protein